MPAGARTASVVAGTMLLAAACAGNGATSPPVSTEGPGATTPSTSSPAPPSSTTQPPGEITFTWSVDPGLAEDGRGTISNGRAESSFVPGRLVLVHEDGSELAGLLERRNGSVVRTLALADYGLTGPSISVIEVDTSTADPDALVPAMSSLGVEGTTIFDGEESAALGAIVAEERASGLLVEFDWISRPTAIPEDTEETTIDTGLVGWWPDAYRLSYYRSDSTQAFGVADAWSFMYYAGVLENRVPLAIVDTGFFVDEDLRDPATHAVDPSYQRFGEPDPYSQYHGYLVASTAVAVPDNSYGTAGVAGVVASPILIQKGEPDLGSGIDGLLRAHAMGARIVNMSYITVIIDEWAHMSHAWDAATRAITADGVLLFGSSGNDGSQLDDLVEDGVIHGTRPCQAPGVVCVGGLAEDSNNRHPDSVWSEAGGSVDIWAPYCVFLYRGFSSVPGVTNVCGTSVSSPFAAGVAALVWASDPSLTAEEVREILLTTAHRSRFPRLNALAAVRAALGPFVGVRFAEPGEGSSHGTGRSVGLAAEVALPTDPEITAAEVMVEFSSDRDGTLDETVWTVPMVHGEPLSVQRVSAVVGDLSEGSHVLTVTARYGDLEGTDTLRISVDNSAPGELEITRPGDGEEFCPGEVVRFRGDAFDVNQQLGLPDSAFVWRSSIDGRLGSGRRVSAMLSPGSHRIRMIVTDEGGLESSDSIRVTVLGGSDPTCVDLAPDVVILEPEDGADFMIGAPGVEWGRDEYGDYVTFTVRVEVTDDHDPSGPSLAPLITLIPGEHHAVQGQGYEVEVTAHLPDGACSVEKWIRARSQDGAGNEGEDHIRVFVSRLC